MDVNFTLVGGKASVYYRSDTGWSVDLLGINSTNSCTKNPLLDINDNKIVQLLGLAAGAWVVSWIKNINFGKY